MSIFRTNSSEALSVGAAAEQHDVPEIENASDPTAIKIRKQSHAQVKNTHATQNLFVRRGAVATTSVYDMIIGAGDEATIALGNALFLSLIASGAATTGELHWGTAR